MFIDPLIFPARVLAGRDSILLPQYYKFSKRKVSSNLNPLVIFFSCRSKNKKTWKFTGIILGITQCFYKSKICPEEKIKDCILFGSELQGQCPYCLLISGY
jgi:hypothetical protein